MQKTRAKINISDDGSLMWYYFWGSSRDNYDTNSFWGKAWIYLQESFFRYSSADDYYELKETLMGRLKKTGEGYHILQNPIGL